MSQDLRAAAAKLESWIKDQAVPLWLERGINPLTGASYERLLPSGQPDVDSNLRVRVQARQVFFFAAAYHFGWCVQGQSIAKAMMSFVQQYACHPAIKPAYVHLLDKDAQILDAKQDLYDYAFFMLANTWMYRISNDPIYLQQVEQLCGHINTCMRSEKGGWIEGDYDYDSRRQNPHMHLMEVFLTLYEVTRQPTWLAYADDMFGLFKNVFYSDDQAVLFEFFDENWKRLQSKKGQIVEPGHMLEWVWLLDWYQRLSGHSVMHYTSTLYDRALKIGMHTSGLLFDAVASNGEVIDSNKRCWGMTELIKASLVQIRAGDKNAEAVAVKAVEDLFSFFLCASTPGSYIDQRDENNKILVDMAPASTLYHLIVAAMELKSHVNDFRFT